MARVQCGWTKNTAKAYILARYVHRNPYERLSSLREKRERCARAPAGSRTLYIVGGPPPGGRREKHDSIHKNVKKSEPFSLLCPFPQCSPRPSLTCRPPRSRPPLPATTMAKLIHITRRQSTTPPAQSTVARRPSRQIARRWRAPLSAGSVHGLPTWRGPPRTCGVKPKRQRSHAEYYLRRARLRSKVGDPAPPRHIFHTSPASNPLAHGISPLLRPTPHPITPPFCVLACAAAASAPRYRLPSRAGEIASIPWRELVELKESLLTRMERCARVIPPEMPILDAHRLPTGDAYLRCPPPPHRMTTATQG